MLPAGRTSQQLVVTCKQLLCHCILCDFHSGLIVSDSYHGMCQAPSKDVVGKRVAHDWFKQVRDGDHDLKDKPTPGQSHKDRHALVGH